jgi:P-type Ca2+ transporter type 2C
MTEKDWYLRSTEEVFQALGTSKRGLTIEESKERLAESGNNELFVDKSDGYIKIFFRQFKDPLIYTLIAAGAVVMALNELSDGIVIFSVIFFNAIVGTIQEGRAQDTLRALKKYIETKVVVVREGKDYIVKDTEVVPGDVVVLMEGDKIPADVRFVELTSLKVDESALTGESLAVEKTSEAIPGEQLPTADQRNMGFKGTNVVAGNGIAVVVKTGTDTEIGKITKEIAAIESTSPLKRDIANLTKLIIWTVLGISAFLLVSGLLLGNGLAVMISTTVSLAISVIPEGLPVVITMVLATGIWRMSKKNVLVKKMQAVEALGQAKVIAVDKTGTITKNEMAVVKVYVNDSVFKVSNDGYNPVGKIDGVMNSDEMNLLGKLSALIPNASVAYDESSKQWRAFGDPTEAAVVAFAGKLGCIRDQLQITHPRIAEIPFNHKDKYRASIYKEEAGYITGVLSAPEILIERSTLDHKHKQKLLEVQEQFAKEGLRVLALGYIHTKEEVSLSDKLIKNVTFLALIAEKDTLRPEVFASLEKTRSAGMKVVMITGDYKVTAEAIAREAGIFRDGDTVLTGLDIEKESVEELAGMLETVSVFARVTPEHKFKIIEAYKYRGEVIAMTGDGVNDAPPLVAADLGVAMGKIGTEVAKEAADIVLLDDNFGSIVSAVEEGRTIYKTIKKVILYLFSTSFGEVFTIAAALFLGWPLIFPASQIIWLNFVTDGFLTVVLALEPKEKDLLKKQFIKPNKYLIDKLMAQRIFIMAIPMAIGTLSLFGAYFYVMNESFIKAGTVALTALAAFQWFNAWNCRSEDQSVFRMNPFSNIFLVLGMVAVITAQLFAVYNPTMQKLLHTTALSPKDWLWAILVATLVIWVEEARKLIYRAA